MNITIAKSSAGEGFICLFFYFVLVLISLLNHFLFHHLYGHFCSMAFQSQRTFTSQSHLAESIPYTMHCRAHYQVRLLSTQVAFCQRGVI